MISTATGLDEHSEGDSAPRGGERPPDRAWAANTGSGGSSNREGENQWREKESSGESRKAVEGEVSKGRTCFEKEGETARPPRLLAGE